jgi:hypothetical protein
MNHQPFEDWILAPEPLSRAQKNQLGTHLRSCTACSALAEVNMALHATRLAVPPAGFTGRFQERLALQKKTARRRQAWGFVLLAASVLGVLVWLAWPMLRDLFQSPVNLLVSWFSTLVSIWNTFQAIVRGGMVLFKVAPGFVPGYIWLILLGSAGGWSLVWVLSLMRFSTRGNR